MVFRKQVNLSKKTLMCPTRALGGWQTIAKGKMSDDPVGPKRRLRVRTKRELQLLERYVGLIVVVVGCVAVRAHVGEPGRDLRVEVNAVVPSGPSASLGTICKN